jgi:hypothetical protein
MKNTLLITTFIFQLMACTSRTPESLKEIKTEFGQYMTLHRGVWWYCGSLDDYKVVGYRRFNMNLFAELVGFKPENGIDKYFKVKFSLNKNNEFIFDDFDKLEKYKKINFTNYPISYDFDIER